MVLLELNSKAGANKKERVMNIIKKKVSALTGPTGFSHKHYVIMRWSTWQLLQPHPRPIPLCHVSIPLDITSLSVPSEPTDTIHTLPGSLYHHSEDFLSNFTWFQSHTLLESRPKPLSPSTDWRRRRFLFFSFSVFFQICLFSFSFLFIPTFSHRDGCSLWIWMIDGF